MKKIIRSDLVLEACEDHPNGCYIRFRSLAAGEKVHHTESRGDDGDVVVEYDSEGTILGVEFYEGLYKYGT